MSLSELPTSAAASGAAGSLEERETGEPQKTEVSPFGKCQPDKIPLLQSLIHAYDESRTRLKPHHKRLLKQIHSLRQAYDGTKALCYCGCGKVESIEHMEIQHITPNPNDNRLISTSVIMPLCNKRLNGKKGGEINKERAAAHHSSFSTVTPLYVRETGACAHAQTSTGTSDYAGVQWTSKEGKKHDRMRPKWDALLWTLFNPEDEYSNWIRRSKLANFARSADFVGEGTSTTFYKMINEDVDCGILKVGTDPETFEEAIIMVWPNDTHKEKLRELALQHSQGKITDDDLANGIKTVAAPLKETRRHWNYLWYVQKKLKAGRPAP